MCKGNRYLSCGRKQIVNSKDCFTLYYWHNCYLKQYEHSITIYKNGLLIEKSKEKSKDKTNYTKTETIKSLHKGSSASNRFLALFSYMPITKTILKQIYNKDIDEELGKDFFGLILINKENNNVQTFFMHTTMSFVVFSEDDCTIAVITDNEIRIIDLNI